MRTDSTEYRQVPPPDVCVDAEKGLTLAVFPPEFFSGPVVHTKTPPNKGGMTFWCGWLQSHDTGISN